MKKINEMSCFFCFFLKINKMNKNCDKVEKEKLKSTATTVVIQVGPWRVSPQWVKGKHSQADRT